MMTNSLLPRLQLALDKLQLQGMLERLDPLAKQAAVDNWSALEFLDALTQAELASRTERDAQRKIRTARFPYMKTLDQFDFSFQPSINERQIRDLATTRFVTNAENLLMLGPPGVGKTHLAVSLGMCAILQGMSVLFYSVADLLEQLSHDAKADRLAYRLQLLCRPQLLIIDEMGYCPIDKRAAQFFFQLVSRRYLKGSIILTSNKSFAEWGDIFSDTVLATALLDRLLHQSATVNIRGSSYRLKDKLKPLHESKKESAA
jgi:DNA replication protein DnaC